MGRRSAPGFVGRFTLAVCLPWCKPFANGLQRTRWTGAHSMDLPPYRSALYGQERTGKHGAIGLITQGS